MAKLHIKGARQNNLKNISLSLEHGTITCVSGPSGAGKSSLVFDTIYSEAQRRYIETFSPYARQFLERLPEPDVREIANLPAAIAVGQANPVRNSRSTVGTLTEITYFARMLFFRSSRPYCEKCGAPARAADWHDIRELAERAGKQGIRKAWLTAAVSLEEIEHLVREGYRRIILRGKEMELSGNDPSGRLDQSLGHAVSLVIDRFLLSSLQEERLKESAEIAFSMGHGALQLVLENGHTETFTRKPACPKCHRVFSEPGAFLFSFNSPQGACPECRGFGRAPAIDWDLVVPDHSLSIREGAIRPLENWRDEKEELVSWCIAHGLDPRKPWRELTPGEREAVLLGKGSWYGIKGIFDWLETKRYKSHVRILLSRYRTYLTCPACNGTRFRPQSLLYRLGGKTIAGFYSLTSQAALSWCRRLSGKEPLDEASRCLLSELERRLGLINQAGLGYLTLDRQSRTLSGGELSRLCISRAISTRLSGILYCLDEPSSGLHPRDVKALAGILHDLKKGGNTLILVENDRQLKRCADRIIELGPGSGAMGGKVVETGSRGYHTGRFEKPPGPEKVQEPLCRSPASGCLEIRDARANNLKAVSCRIPMGAITCICGVSGSGKSSLVEECLYRGILRLKGMACAPPGEFGLIMGWEEFSQIRMIDQEPVSKNPRACPGTYLKILDPVRKLLAGSEEARAAGLKPGYFSVNVSGGGRCGECRGQGVEIIEMQFLPDVMLPCPSCKGKKFRAEAMDFTYRGKNICEILAMTLDEASEFFHDCAPLVKAAGPARMLGLGYLQMGQPLSSLSAGEAQRLKIARTLHTRHEKPSLFILDEPSRGLHHTEIEKLTRQLRQMAERGHSIIVVEHDLQILEKSDWVIELGPEGGARGGKKLFEGTPRELLEKASTPTSRFLAASGNLSPGPNPSRPSCRKVQQKGAGNIEIRGAKHHNLKNIDIEIPKNRLVVITGMSGSGKSSLAFDLVHREAQRRYLESLPSYMKQFVNIHERFDVDSIGGLSPSVAIEQKVSRGGSMSTVATLTETAHYLRLLYTVASRPVCPSCGGNMQKAALEDILDVFSNRAEREDVILLSPRIKKRKGWHHPEIRKGFAAGASMVRVDGKFVGPGERAVLSRYREHDIEWAWGPFEAGTMDPAKLREALETALRHGKGEVLVLNRDGVETVMSSRHFCARCRVSISDPDPLLFSFHSSSGQCPACLGRGISKDSGTCPDCRGSRLSARARLWQVEKRSISDLLSLEIGEAEILMKTWLETAPFPQARMDMARMLVKQVLKRLTVLSKLGLDYLPLDRSGNTLSGGESQRIRLAVQASSNLTGLTIVLDEPTIGLHPRDNRNLMDTLKDLRDKGNTVIVVEHDQETMESADWIIDMGPEGGNRGGRIVAQGTLEEILKHEASRTARAMKRPRRLPGDSGRLKRSSGWLRFGKVSRFNLKNLDVKIPCGAFTVITGVSGSGKSTLLSEIIHKSFLDGDTAGCNVRGTGLIKRVLRIDHSPIGRTPRSCPATFTGIWSDIRFLFSRTQTARIRGLGPGHFSYNVEGGRCEACRGQGYTCQKLSLLPDVLVTCQECGGKRFKKEILDIRWKDKDITDILDMPMDEALEFFAAIPRIRRKLEFMKELGLGYLTLGQPSPTLSGGEAQRLKLSRELSGPSCQQTLYLLDEPTVGLHMEDVERLARCLEKLADLGGTVVVVEHNLDLVTRADWVLDLGPGGGRRGGRLLYQGPLKDFIDRCRQSETARELARFVGRQH